MALQEMGKQKQRAGMMWKGLECRWLLEAGKADMNSLKSTALTTSILDSDLQNHKSFNLCCKQLSLCYSSNRGLMQIFNKHFNSFFVKFYLLVYVYNIHSIAKYDTKHIYSLKEVKRLILGPSIQMTAVCIFKILGL